MKIDINRLFDYMIERDQEENDYRKACEAYFKNHGSYPYFGYGNTSKEIEHIKLLMKWVDMSDSCIRAVLEVLSLNKSQTDRLNAAFKGVKRWYEKETEWQRCMPEALIARLEKYVMGGAYNEI